MRDAEAQAEGEAGSMQGAQCGTRSWVSRITAWAKGSAQPLSHPGIPVNILNILSGATYICMSFKTFIEFVIILYFAVFT